MMGIHSIADVKAAPPWTPDGHLHTDEWFAALFEKGPVAIDEPSGIYQLYGYEAVREFLFHPERWSTAKRLEAVPPEMRVVRLLTSDPPQHLKLRSHFASAYRPKRIPELAARIQAVCSELLDACIEKECFDLITDFAKPLTVIMISDIIGIPEEGRSVMTPMMADLSLGRVDRSGDNSLTKALYSGGELPGMEAIFAYFDTLIAQRRIEPKDDLISALAQIPPEQMKERLDVPALLNEQFGAGQNTTVHLIGSLIYMLHRHRDQWSRLREDRSLIPGAVEETIRLHAPLQARPRIATHDFELEGVQIREGSVGLGWLAGANIDPAHFQRALEFDVGRNPNQHIGFGFGEHFCLGAALARMEVRLALEAWLDRIEDFEPADSTPPAWLDDFILHGLSHYPLRVKARGSNARAAN